MFSVGREIEHSAEMNELVHTGGLYHIDSSPLISTANQWTGFCMIWTSIVKQLNVVMYLSSFQLLSV